MSINDDVQKPVFQGAEPEKTQNFIRSSLEEPVAPMESAKYPTVKQTEDADYSQNKSGPQTYSITASTDEDGTFDDSSEDTSSSGSDYSETVTSQSSSSGSYENELYTETEQESSFPASKTEGETSIEDTSQTDLETPTISLSKRKSDFEAASSRARIKPRSRLSQSKRTSKDPVYICLNIRISESKENTESKKGTPVAGEQKFEHDVGGSSGDHLDNEDNDHHVDEEDGIDEGIDDIDEGIDDIDEEIDDIDEGICDIEDNDRIPEVRQQLCDLMKVLEPCQGGDCPPLVDDYTAEHPDDDCIGRPYVDNDYKAQPYVDDDYFAEPYMDDDCIAQPYYKDDYGAGSVMDGYRAQQRRSDHRLGVKGSSCCCSNTNLFFQFLTTLMVCFLLYFVMFGNSQTVTQSLHQSQEMQKHCPCTDKTPVTNKQSEPTKGQCTCDDGPKDSNPYKCGFFEAIFNNKCKKRSIM